MKVHSSIAPLTDRYLIVLSHIWPSINMQKPPLPQFEKLLYILLQKTAKVHE